MVDRYEEFSEFQLFGEVKTQENIIFFVYLDYAEEYGSCCFVSVKILSYCSPAWPQTCYVVEMTFELFLKFAFILFYMSGCFA